MNELQPDQSFFHSVKYEVNSDLPISIELAL